MVTTLLKAAFRAAAARDSSGRDLPSPESQTRITHGIESHVIRITPLCLEGLLHYHDYCCYATTAPTTPTAHTATTYTTAPTAATTAPTRKVYISKFHFLRRAKVCRSK
jgi:hypothetical protein